MSARQAARRALSLPAMAAVTARAAQVPAAWGAPALAGKAAKAVAGLAPRAFEGARSFAASAADEELRASMHKHGRSTKDAAFWDDFKKGLPATFIDDLMYRYSQFRQADKDKDGKVTKEELKELLSKMEDGVDDAAVEKLLEAADVDGNGVLDINEFVKMFQASK